MIDKGFIGEPPGERYARLGAIRFATKLAAAGDASRCVVETIAQRQSLCAQRIVQFRDTP
jgi:hypothetical protein